MATNGLNLQTSGLTFTTSTVERAIINDVGRMGLGTLAPAAMLHVIPTGSTSSVRFESLASGSTDTNYVVSDGDGVLSTRNDVVTLDGTQTLTNKTINGSQLVDSSVANTKLTNDSVTITAGDGLISGGSVSLGSSITLDIGEGTGILINADEVSLKYSGTTNFINSATDLESTAIALSDTIVYHDATDDNVKKGLVSDLPFTDSTGTVTSVAISGTDGIDVDSGSPITTSGTITLGLSNIPNASLSNSTITFNGTTGSNPAAALGGTLNIISSDSSVVVSGGTDTIDITINTTNTDNIYTTNGTLTGARTVTQSGNTLSFVGGDFSVDSTTFNVDESTNAVGVGTITPNASAVLEVTSTTKGFLFPRMTETQRTGIGTPATGLMVYQTDGAEGVYIYKSFGWVQVI